MSERGIPPLSRFERSPVTDLLADCLRAVPVGETVGYRELSEVAGEPITGGHNLLRSAREIVWKEDRIIFDPVPTVGLKRMDEDGKVGAADWFLTKARNAARRSRRALQATDLNALTPAARVRYMIADVRAGLFAQFSSKRAAGAIGRALAGGNDPKKLRESVAESLKQF